MFFLQNRTTLATIVLIAMFAGNSYGFGQKVTAVQKSKIEKNETDSKSRDDIYQAALMSLGKLHDRLAKKDYRVESIGRYFQKFKQKLDELKSFDEKPRSTSNTNIVQVKPKRRNADSAGKKTVGSEYAADDAKVKADQVSKTHRTPDLRVMKIKTRSLDHVSQSELKSFLSKAQPEIDSLEKQIESGTASEKTLDLIKKLDQKLTKFEKSSKEKQTADK